MSNVILDMLTKCEILCSTFITIPLIAFTSVSKRKREIISAYPLYSQLNIASNLILNVNLILL